MNSTDRWIDKCEQLRTDGRMDGWGSCWEVYGKRAEKLDGDWTGQLGGWISTKGQR